MKNLKQNRSKIQLKRISATLLAIIITPLSILLINSNEYSEKSKQEIEFKEKIILPVVSIIEITKTSQKTKVSGFGEVKARYQLNVATEVTGKVIKIGSEFQKGNWLKKGYLLLEIDKTNYQQIYLSAKKDLADAKITLLQKKNEQVQAKDEWKRSGLRGEPESPLLFGEPQVLAADLNVKKSQASVAVASLDLKQTMITSAFDSLVIDRNVSVGSYVQKGNIIATLHSANSVEIRVLLPESRWRLLPSEEELKLSHEENFTLTDPQNTERHWQANVLRIEKFIEIETRQRALVLTVHNPMTQGLMIGDFLSVTIEGKILTNTLYVPNSALSQTGHIWYVDQENMLQRFMAKIYYTDQDKTLIQAPKGTTTLNIVVRPISMYKPGMKIQPKSIKKENIL